MSKKSELINVLAGYKSQYESIQTQISNINRSADYTEEAKKERVDKIVAGFEPTVQQCHDRGISIIDSGLEALQSKWRANSTGKLSDAGYQMGLANVIKMLEADAIHDIEDIKNIIATYKGDYNALATIGNIIKSSSHSMGFIGLIPKDNREYNIKLLNQLKGNIDSSINPNTIKNNGGWGMNDLGSSSVGVLWALDGSVDFLNTRFTDSLELVEESL